MVYHASGVAAQAAKPAPLKARAPRPLPDRATILRCQHLDFQHLSKIHRCRCTRKIVSWNACETSPSRLAPHRSVPPPRLARGVAAAASRPLEAACTARQRLSLLVQNFRQTPGSRAPRAAERNDDDNPDPVRVKMAAPARALEPVSLTVSKPNHHWPHPDR